MLEKKYAVAIIIFIGILIVMTLLYFPFPARLSIEGLQDSYKVKESIAFTLIANGCGLKCDHIEINVMLKERNQILYSTVIISDGLPVFPLLTKTIEHIPSDGIITIDESGNYTMVIDYNGAIIEKHITIT
ncbi:MAG: hypothetical protein HW410_943 [Nitrosarchaeum sp.]|nr:hypothetical protein [Nitrosarchaeum sp.]